MLSLLCLHAINVEDARPGEWRLRAALIGLSLCSGVAFQDGDLSFFFFFQQHLFLCTLRGLRLPVAQDRRLPRHRLLPGPMRPYETRPRPRPWPLWMALEVQMSGWFRARSTSSTSYRSQAEISLPQLSVSSVAWSFPEAVTTWPWQSESPRFRKGGPGSPCFVLFVLVCFVLLFFFWPGDC